MTDLKNLEPRLVWQRFAEIKDIARPSLGEQQVMQHLAAWSDALGFEHRSDSTGNLLVRVPASPGCESAPPVVIQGHVDIVVADSEDAPPDASSADGKIPVERGNVTAKGDFVADPAGGWVRAPYTTLGADNGIGCAMGMAASEDSDVVHPPLELLFTVDEERGMTGALQLDAAALKLQGRRLINLDTEVDNELTIGSAGGMDSHIHWHREPVAIANHTTALEVLLRDLQGGHSGIEINSGRANAIRLVARALQAAAQICPLQIVRIEGGEKRNAIPRMCRAVIVIPSDSVDAARTAIQQQNAAISAQFAGRDQPVRIQLKPVSQPPNEAFSAVDSQSLLDLLLALPTGVFTMTAEIPELPETSNNLAIVEFRRGQVEIHCSSRSALEPGMQDVVATLHAAARLAGATVQHEGSYPGWKPNLESAMLAVSADAYRRIFKEEPKILAVHAGLECGVLASHIQDLDCISFGPNIRGNHAPGEHVEIASVAKSYRYLMEVLAALAKS